MENKKPLSILEFYLILILILVVGYFLFSNETNQENNAQSNNVITNNHSVNYLPHIDLSYSLNRSRVKLAYTGSIKGFVVFQNKEDQPKSAIQYYIIEPTNFTDDRHNQIFTIEDIVVVGDLPLYSLGKSNFYVIKDSLDKLVLMDQNGNEFIINLDTKNVTMNDATGDSIYLITNETDYNIFMKDFKK